MSFGNGAEVGDRFAGPVTGPCGWPIVIAQMQDRPSASPAPGGALPFARLKIDEPQLQMTNQQKNKAAAGTAAARVRHHPKFLLLDRRAQYIAGQGIGADPDMLLVTKQLAEWLGVPVQWLEIGRSKGYGPPFRRLGTRAIRYRVGDILRWLEDRSHKSTADYAKGEA